MKILLVEDHEDTLRAMTIMLRREGHEVLTAMTLSEAKELCKTKGLELIVCDISLPDGDAWEMAQLGQDCGIPAIAVTALGMDYDLRKSQESGFFAYLVKPVSVAQLQYTVRSIAGFA